MHIFVGVCEGEGERGREGERVRERIRDGRKMREKERGRNLLTPFSVAHKYIYV